MLDIDKAINIIASASRSEAVNDDYIEYDDLNSESLLTYWKVHERVKSVEEGGRPVAFLRRLVSNVAKNMRTEAKARTSQYIYRVSDVRALLTDALNGPKEAQHSGNTDLDDEDFPNVRSDILVCMKQLPQDDRRSIISRYYYGDLPANGSASRKRLDRAVERLTYTMNNYRGDSEFVGSRKTITNAHARALIDGEV